MSKPVRLTLMIVPWILILGWIFWYFSPYLALRYAILKSPVVVSQRLTHRLLEVGLQPGVQNSYYYSAITFNLPYAVPDVKQSEVGVIFSDPISKKRRLIISESTNLKELLSSGKGGSLTLIAEKKGLVTNYDYMKYMLDLTPDMISPFNRTDIALGFLFLTTKGLSVLHSPLYSFETPVIKGFQMGEPLPVGMVQAVVFISDNEAYRFLFQGYSQSEIDKTLNSITIRNNTSSQKEAMSSCLFNQENIHVGDTVCSMSVTSIAPDGKIVFKGTKALSVIYYAGDMAPENQFALRKESRNALPYQDADNTMHEHVNFYQNSGEGFEKFYNELVYGIFGITNDENSDDARSGENGSGTLTIDTYTYHGEEIQNGLTGSTNNNVHIIDWKSDL